MKLIYFALTKSAGALAEKLCRACPGDIVTRETLTALAARESSEVIPFRETMDLTKSGKSREPMDMAEAGKSMDIAKAGISSGCGSFADAVSDAWGKYDGMVFIMASGIVVRTIAPLLKSKTSDPAVVVMDAGGRFAVSLLSGHLGGANALAKALAHVCGGQAVITTGTDVAHTLAFDVLAKANQCLIENIKDMKYISSAMIEREPVDVYCTCPAEFRWPDNVRVYTTADDQKAGVDQRNVADQNAAAGQTDAANRNVAASQTAAVGERIAASEVASSRQNTTAHVAVVIGHRFEIEVPEMAYDKVLYLSPKDLCVGIGCKKNIPPQMLEDAFVHFLELNKICSGEVAGLATIALKKDEPAILKLSEKYGLPLYIIEDEAIKALESAGAVQVSAFVKKTTGVGAVSEGSALALAQKLEDNGKSTAGTLAAAENMAGAAAPGRAVLICPKTKYDGITFALAQCCHDLVAGEDYI